MEKISWWIPYIEPSLEIAEMITKRLMMKDPIELLFMKRSMEQRSIPTGSNYSWKLANF